MKIILQIVSVKILNIIKVRTSITKEEVRDLFPLGSIQIFKKFRCFDKVIDEIVKVFNNSKTSNVEAKIILLSETCNFNADDVLMRAFTWDKSIYGYDYWFDIYHKIGDYIKSSNN